MSATRPARLLKVVVPLWLLLAGAADAATQQVQGELKVYVEDYPLDGAQTNTAGGENQFDADSASAGMTRLRAEHRYYLETDDGTRIALEPGESEALEGMTTGARVAVEGRGMALSTESGTTPERMRVTDAERLAPARADDRNTAGRTTIDGSPVAASHDNGSVDKRRVLGVVVKFKGSDEKVDANEARKALLEGRRSAESFYRFASGGSADSGGQLAFLPPSGGDPKVAEVEIDDSTDSCGNPDYVGWASKADDKLAKRGIDFDTHGYRVYFLPPGVTSSCGWGGLAPLGCGDCRAWVRGTSSAVTGHELGHNLRLPHTKAKINGEIRTYGESTLMGIGGVFINVPQREFLGFYDDHQDKVKTIDSGFRTLTIGSLHTDFDSGQPHAVTLPMDNSDEQYYIYHLADNGPGRGFSGPSGKVAVTRARPGNPDTLNLENMTAGDQFTDDDNDITVTVNAIGDDQATVQVQNGEKQIAAVDTEWTMAPGKEYKGQLEGNDPQERDLTFLKAQGPSQGSVSINGDGSFVYTANEDASGNDSFTFRVRSGEVTSEPATAKIEFNQPPQTKDVTAEVDPSEGGEIELRVSDKESDPKTLAYEIVDKPDKGTVEMNSEKEDGPPTITYVPNEGATGQDSFTYRASDSYSQSGESEVVVELDASDDSSDPFDDGNGDGTNNETSDSDSGGGGAVGWWSLFVLLGLAAGRGRAAPSRSAVR